MSSILTPFPSFNEEEQASADLLLSMTPATENEWGVWSSLSGEEEPFESAANDRRSSVRCGPERVNSTAPPNGKNSTYPIQSSECSDSILCAEDPFLPLMAAPGCIFSVDNSSLCSVESPQSDDIFLSSQSPFQYSQQPTSSKDYPQNYSHLYSPDQQQLQYSPALIDFNFTSLDEFTDFANDVYQDYHQIEPQQYLIEQPEQEVQYQNPEG